SRNQGRTDGGGVDLVRRGVGAIDVFRLNSRHAGRRSGDERCYLTGEDLQKGRLTPLHESGNDGSRDVLHWVLTQHAVVPVGCGEDLVTAYADELLLV